MHTYLKCIISGALILITKMNDAFQIIKIVMGDRISPKMIDRFGCYMLHWMDIFTPFTKRVETSRKKHRITILCTFMFLCTTSMRERVVTSWSRDTLTHSADELHYFSCNAHVRWTLIASLLRVLKGHAGLKINCQWPLRLKCNACRPTKQNNPLNCFFAHSLLFLFV